jgi:hypothetical protein
MAFEDINFNEASWFKLGWIKLKENKNFKQTQLMKKKN